LQEKCSTLAGEFEDIVHADVGRAVGAAQHAFAVDEKVDIRIASRIVHDACFERRFAPQPMLGIAGRAGVGLREFLGGRAGIAEIVVEPELDDLQPVRGQLLEPLRDSLCAGDARRAPVRKNHNITGLPRNCDNSYALPSRPVKAKSGAGAPSRSTDLAVIVAVRGKGRAGLNGEQKQRHNRKRDHGAKHPQSRWRIVGNPSHERIPSG